MRKKADKPSLKTVLQLNIRALKVFYKEFPGMLRAEICYRLCSSLSPYLTIWFSARIIDELTGARDAQRLYTLIALTLASVLVAGLLTGISKRVYFSYCNSLDENYFHLYTAPLIHMDYSEFASANTQNLIANIVQLKGHVSWGIKHTYRQFSTLLDTLFSLSGAVVLTFTLFTKPVPGDWAFLGHPLMSILVVCLFMLCSRLSAYVVLQLDKHYARGDAFAPIYRTHMAYGVDIHMPDRAADVRLNRQAPIAAYYLKEHVSRGLIKLFNPSLWNRPNVFHIVVEVLSVMTLGLVYLFVALKAAAGAFGVGSVTQYVGAITIMLNSITTLIRESGNVKLNIPYLQRNFELLDAPERMYKGSLSTEKRNDRKFEIEFRNVSFRYPETERYVLKSINFRFTIGERLAIVGENGSGKSTFIKLLCRLYDPTEGEILLNGIDIRKYNLEEYQKLFSMVFQDYHLFALSLGENVAGTKVYDHQAAEQALRDAGFGARLDSLPDSLDTMLYKDWDQSGVSLSGGEAQKVAIARALYKDAPFIILDEPTAALDPLAEADIYAHFNSVSGDRTALYISHRLSSCRFCDHVLVFDQGEIIEYGSHEELLHRHGKYAELWHAQAQYYTEVPAP